MDEKKFDDIILEKDNKSEKIKKILLRVIALVILFLVVMIVMKLINADDAPSSEQNAQGIFPTENNNFENTPVANAEPSDEFAALRAQLQGLDANSSTPSAAVNAESIKPLPPEPQSVVPAPEAPKPESEVKNETPKVEPKKEEAKKPAAKKEPAKSEAPKTAQKAESKAEPKKQAAKPATAKKEEAPKSAAAEKPADAKDLFKNVEVTSGELPAGTYIQIFSVAKFDPKSRELEPIKANGYAYKLYKSEVGGKEITRVLVGPFTNQEISAEMDKIRKNVRKDAFVYRIK